jgi:cell fate regulator YaaT (PSP1 superfamily)
MPEDDVVEETTEKPEADWEPGADWEPEAEEEGCPGCCRGEGGGRPCCAVEGDTGETPVPRPGDQSEEAWPAAAVRVVGLCFRKGGKVYYFHPNDFPLALGDYVVVETDKGVDIGEVVTLKPRLEPGEDEPTRQVLRPATPGDVRRKQSLEQRERQAFRTCEFKINEHGLEMKLIDASYTLDGKRLTFAFVSEARVDFRDLVRDLAQTFRCRIELRQVGVRDQAKLIGGLGPCGRPLCCATFLRDFCSVGIRLAKDQGLSLNPAKISGACDRLMCCLRYEHAQYSEVNRRLPRMGERVECAAGAGEVVERNLLTGAVTLRTLDGKEVVLAEKDLFPEGIKVARPAPQQRRREEHRPRERRARPRGERREEVQAEATPAPEAAAAEPGAPAEASGAPPATAPPAEDQPQRGRRKRGPRHRRKLRPAGPPTGESGGSGAAGPEGGSPAPAGE